MNSIDMTVNDWNEYLIWEDSFIQELDKKESYVKPESEKTEEEKHISRLADVVYYQAKTLEPCITADISSIIENTKGKLLTTVSPKTGLRVPSHVLKEKASIERKIIADSYAYLGDFEKASSGIRDSVRYTIIFEDEDYTQGVDNFLHQLENLGYYDIEVKNNWSTNKDDKKRTCQGINVKLKSREGMYFEIQFHTPNSHDIKETNTRRLYRVIRDKNAPDFRRNQANNLRILLQSRVNAPDNIEDYRFISNNNSMRR